MRAVPIVSGTADAQGFAGGCYLRGWNFREAAGTPAVGSLTLRDGTTTSDTVIAEISLAASGTNSHMFQTGKSSGIYCPNGIFVDRIAGTTVGVLYIDDK